MLTTRIFAASIFAYAPGAAAQNYPDKPVQIVIQGSTAGTNYDVAATLAKKLMHVWGQQVDVEAKGGGGSIALDTIAGVAKSAPDGHRLLLASSTYTAVPSVLANLPYDPIKDFVPIASLVSQPNVLVVGRSTGIKCVSELIANAKANPGVLTMGSADVGQSHHLMGESFKLKTGIVATHVPLGVTQLTQAVIAGRVTFWFAPFSAVQTALKDGSLVPLGVSTARRFVQLPEVPTVAESGVKGFDQRAWYGIWAPAGISRPLVEKLSADISRALAGTDLRDAFAAKGYEVLVKTQPEFAKFVQDEIAAAIQTIKDVGQAAKYSRHTHHLQPRPRHRPSSASVPVRS